MRRIYKGKIKELKNIIVSDPSYNEEVDMRFEKTFRNKNNLEVEININDVDEILYYEMEKFNAKGIEFTILIKNPECIDVSLDIINRINYNSKNYEHINKTEITTDSACVALGINKQADMIKTSKDDCQPEDALKTTIDGIFGEVKEALNNNETQFLEIYGYLDNDTEYSCEDIKNYLIKNFEIKDLKLEEELDEEEELHRVIFKEPGKELEIIKIRKDLQAEQRLVGGLIETAPFTQNTILICNEEGKLYKLPPNIKYGKSDVIAGNFFIIGRDIENCDFRSLTEEEIDECIEHIEKMSLEINEEQQI